MATLGLYWRTIRHLKARQILGRAWFQLYHPRPDLRPAPPLRDPVHSWVPPVRRTANMIGPGSFVFLNEAGRLHPQRQDGGWDDPHRAKLWRYNLHYFDDLNADGAEERREWHRALVADWLKYNPPGRGTGWEPYPTALRIVNWIKAAQGGFVLSSDAVHSLAVQARWLARRVEHHLSGNHLLANAKALCFAGAFFAGREAEGWFARGSRILEQELPEQILGDGGHYELSPMYHALVLEDLLDLINLSRCFAAGRSLQTLCQGRIGPMRSWLAALNHPDGEIAFFNDAALGIAPSPTSLDHYAERLGFAPVAEGGRGVRHLEPSGYLSLVTERMVLLIDAANVGPDHQPGHAHADTLCFELSVSGQRVLVNGGTSEYGSGSERLRQRGTAAHNTLTINGANSSEVWSGFRVGRRARVTVPVITRNGDTLCVTASHDGYRYLPGHPVHQRCWEIDPQALTIRDRVTGPAQEKAEAHFHFAPGLSLSGNGRAGVARHGGLVVLRWEVLDGDARIVPDTHHPRFGVTVPTQALILSAQNNRASLKLIPETIN